jgi:hypothetical protein
LEKKFAHIIATKQYFETWKPLNAPPPPSPQSLPQSMPRSSESGKAIVTIKDFSRIKEPRYFSEPVTILNLTWYVREGKGIGLYVIVILW